jgi:hypothetical protein
MPIDIDTLTEPELIDLNHRVVARLRFLGTMRAHAAMLDFSIGDRVCFRPAGQAPIAGMLTRYNKRTVTVITDDGRQWNVSPSLLSKALPRGVDGTASNLVPLRRR